MSIFLKRTFVRRVGTSHSLFCNFIIYVMNFDNAKKENFYTIRDLQYRFHFEQENQNT